MYADSVLCMCCVMQWNEVTCTSRVLSRTRMAQVVWMLAPCVWRTRVAARLSTANRGLCVVGVNCILTLYNYMYKEIFNDVLKN